MSAAAHDTPWMLVAEVVEYSRVGKTEVHAALADGTLRGSQRKPGGRWRVHRDDVDTWLRGEPAPLVRPQFTRTGRAS